RPVRVCELETWRGDRKTQRLRNRAGRRRAHRSVSRNSNESVSEHGLRHPVASFAQLDREALVAVLTTVSEHSRAGIVLLDERGEALFMNTRFQQLWELPPELVKSGSGESRRTHLQSLVTQPDMICRLHRFSGDVRSRLFEEEVVLKDGRTFAASTAPVMDDSG